MKQGNSSLFIIQYKLLTHQRRNYTQNLLRCQHLSYTKHPRQIPWVLDIFTRIPSCIVGCAFARTVTHRFFCQWKKAAAASGRPTRCGVYKKALLSECLNRCCIFPSQIRLRIWNEKRCRAKHDRATKWALFSRFIPPQIPTPWICGGEEEWRNEWAFAKIYRTMFV